MIATVLVATAAGTQMPLGGWNASALYALVQSLAAGTPRIDRHLNQSGDIAWFRGHYYAAKSPGLAVFSLPVYFAFDALHALTPLKPRKVGQVGPPGARHVEPRAVWEVNLTVVASFLVVMLLMMRTADGVRPGVGLAVALMLGVGTLLLPFATAYFSHVVSATLALASFALLFRPGREPLSRRALLAAGVIGGLAAFTELPLAVVGGCLWIYAMVERPRMLRGALYAAGFGLGLLPLAVYDIWAFGSPLRTGYSATVKVLGKSGHAVVGPNGTGVLGLTYPHVKAALDLLFSDRGLFVLTPVTLVALFGLPLLARRGFRREAWLVGAVALVMLLYNASYYLPFGGWTPGPRFLIGLLPFLSLPLAAIHARWPLLTLAAALVSAFWMMIATLVGPLQPGSASPAHWIYDLLHHQRTNPGSIFGTGVVGIAVFVVPIGLALLVSADTRTRSMVLRSGRRADRSPWNHLRAGWRRPRHGG